MDNLKLVFTIVAVLLMLLCERLLILYFTRKPSCREFIRRHPILHPNGISLMRIPQGAVAIAIAAMGYWQLAILWFAFWMVTDLTDGTIARTCDLATPTGAWLDPLSDKCMSFPALFYLALGPAENVQPPQLPILWVVIYCAIDILGQCSRLFCTKKNANSFGKVKTALITVLISALALNQLSPAAIPFLNQRFVNLVLFACVVFAFLSAYCKIIPNKWYANTLTFLNFLCGILAIWAAWNCSLKHNLMVAFVLVFTGQFFDLFDGRMARIYGSTRLGALFDDIADGTSFGLAVGSMVFICLWNGALDVPVWIAAVVAIFYVLCLIFRLYRFLKPTKIMPKGIFQGLPAPAGALLTGSFVIGAWQLQSCWAIAVAAVVTILASILMISSLPYRHFGQDLWPSLPNGVRFSLLIMVVIFCCIALVSRDWAKAFIWFTSCASIIYAAGAIASKKYLAALEAKHQEESLRQ